MATCSNCKGSKKVRCDKCNGTGKIRNTSYIGLLSELTSLANDWTKCYRCNGSGRKTCDRCRGTGRYDDD